MSWLGLDCKKDVETQENTLSEMGKGKIVKTRKTCINIHLSIDK